MATGGVFWVAAREYWIKSADSDLKAAEALFESANYDWCLFRIKEFYEWLKSRLK